MSGVDELPSLGSHTRDRATGIEGTVICHEVWLDKTPRVAIQRDGVDHNGQPWDLHWVNAYWLVGA